MKSKALSVPRLRFPEFRDAGDWDERPLGKIANVLQGFGFPEKYQGKVEGLYPFYKVSDISKALAAGSHLIETSANYVDDVDIVALKVKTIPVGTTIFAKIGEAIRSNRRAITTRESLIDNNTAGVKSKKGKADDLFVYYLFSNICLIDHAGGVVPSVNKTTMESIPIFAPKLPEQQKIAACLTSIDDLITAEAQKLDALKTHKKGLMQKLFPRQGEVIPRLRFPEFRNAEGWKEKQLGDILSVGNGRDHKHLADGNIPVYGSGGYMRSVNEYLYDGESVCIGRKGTIDNPIFLSGKFWTVDTLFYTHSYMDCLPFFAYAIFQNINWLDHNQAGGIPSLSKANIEKIDVAVPTLPEQQKIAACLTSIDNLITAQAQKLDALKTHKKGLMQQLFPTSDEVKV